MPRRGWVLVAVVAVLMLVTGAAIGALLSGSTPSQIWEALTRQTPEARIGAYLEAVWRGDRDGALGLWKLPEWQTVDPGRFAELGRRRTDVTDALLVAQLDRRWKILEIEWWTTCCEPHVTCDSSAAGGCRVRVQLLDDTGSPLQYRFDLFTPLPYWGAAMGNPVRRWLIRDVHPVDEEPLFWTLLHECSVRSVDATPSRPPD